MAIINIELKDMKKIKNFFEDIKKEFGINENCKIHLIPYFHCKDKGMEGISAILLANNFHFTCHTFSSKETLFIDCFGNAINSDKLTKKILQYYPTNNYDLCNNKQDIDDIDLEFLNDVIKYEKAKKLIREILHTIKMTKISELFEIKNSDYEYDLLQPIAESHISIHCHLGITYIDIFSCKTFDENTILNVLNFKNFDIKTIERGIYFK